MIDRIEQKLTTSLKNRVLRGCVCFRSSIYSLNVPANSDKYVFSFYKADNGRIQWEGMTTEHVYDYMTKYDYVLEYSNEFHTHRFYTMTRYLKKREKDAVQKELEYIGALFVAGYTLAEVQERQIKRYGTLKYVKAYLRQEKKRRA